MLAFVGLERDENGSFTDECELGADLVNESLAALVNIDRLLTAFFIARAKAVNKPRNV